MPCGMGYTSYERERKLKRLPIKHTILHASIKRLNFDGGVLDISMYRLFHERLNSKLGTKKI